MITAFFLSIFNNSIVQAIIFSKTAITVESDAKDINKKLLDDAEQDGRIDAATRPIYENLLAKDRENGEKALEKLSPKRSVMTDLRVNPTGESPWNKRMSEIKDKLNHK